MTGIFEDLTRDWDHAEHAVISRLPHSGWFDRREHPYASQAPAALPVTVDTTTTTEDRMQLSQIAADVKDAAENADQWVKTVLEQHLPGLLATAQRYENSPIVQALETAALPPALEAEIAVMINALAAKYPAAAVQQAQQPVAA